MLTKHLLDGTYHAPTHSDRTQPRTAFVTIPRKEYDRLLEENHSLKMMLEETTTRSDSTG